MAEKLKEMLLFRRPLTFLSELRHRFIETLQLLPEQVIFPDDSQYYVAIGAAILANNGQTRTIDSLIQQLESQKNARVSVSQTLPPLFKNQAELAEFQKGIRKVLSLTNYFLSKKGPLFLGIDAGSTTSKLS